MEPEIWNIISRFKHEKKYVQLISNGTLITERVAQKIKDAGCDSVQISIDGLEETHDYQRQMTGCFAKSVKGIRTLVEKGVPVAVNTLVSQRNLSEIPHLLEKMVEWGVTQFRTSRLILMGRGDVLESEVLTPLQTKSLIEFLLEQRRLHRGTLDIVPDECMSFLGRKIEEYNLSWYGCPAGRTECGVDSSGEVYPCIFLAYKEFAMGNLLHDDFDAIWHSEAAEHFRKIERVCKCEIFEFCKGGCPAAAYARYQDAARKDPYCWRDEND
jgi:radical SAM protein with 4Fe4S-binding SPASM domain